MLDRKFARSTMCGSLAALWMLVVPFAETAISMLFTVAPTLGMSRYTSEPVSPRSRSACATSTPPTVSTAAPSARMPLTVWSIGRAPKLPPPGSGTSARPKMPTSTGAR